MYGENNEIRRVRGVQNAHLIDSVQQPLKSYGNYKEAAQVYLATPLQEYLQHFNILIPGDWPSQFYQRQFAYNEPPGDLGAPFKNTVATMGPLQCALNGQENVVLKFIDFFKPFYHHHFGKQLANKPKTWRITLMLELLYGGWTLIRQPALARLQRFKDLQFCTLLNPVDNYVPLTLSIYSIFFKSNAFPDYVQAMQRIWVMYYSFNRKHYDKAPLVFLSMVEYWKATNHPLYNLLQEHLHVSDEYPVENFHSLLRARTNEWDIPVEIQRKARQINDQKHHLHHFSTYFVPPRRAMMSHNQLRRLKIKSAYYLLGKIQEICANPLAAQEQPRLFRQRKKVSWWILPNLFGQLVVQNVLLPLGYQWYGNDDIARRLQTTGQAAPFAPQQQQPCDRAGCPNITTHSPVLFHSFHAICIPVPEQNICFICSAGLRGAVRQKATAAQTAIMQPDANVGQHPQESDREEEQDDDNDDLGEVQNMTAAEAALQVQQLTQLVTILPAVQLL